ncbi:MAG TPA: hypothetical protein VG621_00855 [Candidatus Paceibacterota bacterium]|nr:hypothetical protein [Candidatus Paceibacterota bacterium]
MDGNGYKRTVVVNANWNDGQWKFNCNEFDENSKWNDGQQVFSPETFSSPIQNNF